MGLAPYAEGGIEDLDSPCTRTVNAHLKDFDHQKFLKKYTTNMVCLQIKFNVGSTEYIRNHLVNFYSNGYAGA